MQYVNSRVTEVTDDTTVLEDYHALAMTTYTMI